MNSPPQSFKSVHDYLDFLFENQDPTKETVILAKKSYWKAYNLNLIRKRRKKNREFSVSFTNTEFKLIKDRMSSEQAVSQFIRGIVLSFVKEECNIRQAADTAVIEQQLFLIVELLQDLAETEVGVNENILKQLESQIEELQNKIESQFDN